MIGVNLMAVSFRNSAGRGLTKEKEAGTGRDSNRNATDDAMSGESREM
jgi:hypothetical protein